MSSTETAAKRDVQKLQRIIINALEDVKAIDIQVFNTEHLSPLFERVIVASGTSNRQTQALAASVRDDVRDAGLDKPRMEGQEVGEWIIVDCGSAVVHVMQPAIRAYYRLEEIWGDKPVRTKAAAPKKLVKASTAAAPAAASKAVAKKATTGKAAPKSAAKTAPKKAAAQKISAKSTPAKKAAPAKKATPTKKAVARKGTSKRPVR
jgi:ribosome-associated protein